MADYHDLAEGMGEMQIDENRDTAEIAVPTQDGAWLIAFVAGVWVRLHTSDSTAEFCL